MKVELSHTSMHPPAIASQNGPQRWPPAAACRGSQARLGASNATDRARRRVKGRPPLPANGHATNGMSPAARMRNPQPKPEAARRRGARRRPVCWQVQARHENEGRRDARTPSAPGSRRGDAAAVCRARRQHCACERRPQQANRYPQPTRRPSKFEARVVRGGTVYCGGVCGGA